MKIDLLILEEETKRFKESLHFFEVRPFIQDLQAHGVFPQIINTLDKIQEDTFYLLILTSTLPPELLPVSPSILVMGGSMADVIQGSKQFHFAGICRYIYYRDRAPFIYGHPVVGKAIGIYSDEDQDEVDHGSGEVLALLQPEAPEEKRLISFLLEYLQMYDQMGLKHRGSPVVKR